MRPQAYQTPEIRDENDSIIQQGTFGKKTPFVNSQNDGILDYIINNLEAIKGMSLAATIVVSSLPSAGQAGKFYLLDDGTENSGKVYIYKDKWVEVTTQAVGLSAYQIALKNGYEGTEQEWLENEVYGDDIVSAETDSDGYFIVHTRQGKTIKTALKPLVDAKASADKAKISETNAKTSETNSANSAAAALASQEASANSQTKAKTSETNAKTSELNAKASENNAKNSETNAKNSATAAAGSASVATTQAVNSSNSATASQKSATASADSASAAHTSEVNASSSASAASVSAGKAKSSETNAKTYETNAKASELNTKASENNAKSSENLAKAWAMSENSPDGITGNKSSKTWAVEAKASASNSASSASSSQSSATASASSASDAKVSETNAAKSATAAAQSAENAKLFDPTSYAKRSEIFPITDTGRKDIKHTITDLNDIKCISSPSWSCIDSSYVKTMSNCPTQTAFYLFNVRNGVSSTSKNDTFTNLTSYYYYIVQLLLDIGGAMWVRTCFNSSKETFNFSNWKKVASINDIPTKTSQLTNDSNFATIAQLPDLTVYATKTELENGFTTASLTVSGETSVPTPSTENNSKTIANTEFVHGVVNDLVNGAPAALNTLQELATALGNDPNFSTTILNKIGEKESKTDAQIEYKKLQGSIDTKQNLLTFDTTPKYGSENPVTSDGIKKAIEAVEAGAPDFTPYMKKTADSNLSMGSYSLSFPGVTISSKMVNSVPMLIIKATGRGVNVYGNLMMKNVTVATEDYVSTAIPTKVSQLSDDVGIAKISNGHLIINGSELWIE